MFEDKYRVDRVLGQGDAGVVMLAENVAIGQRVAIRCMTGTPLDEVAVERFLKDARSTVSFRSEHVGRVIDVGQTHRGSPFLVMEYIDGHDLGTELLRGPLSVAQAAEYGIQMCAALAEAHARGMRHLDLKPSNLFVTRKENGTPILKVLDFGGAKASTDPGVTAQVLESPAYLSPEQLRHDDDLDERVDIWAVGVLLFEMVAGAHPFRGGGGADLCRNIVERDPAPLSPLVAPPEFAKVVRCCLRKHPEDRFPCVADLALALTPFAPRRSKGVARRVRETLDVGTGQVRLPGMEQLVRPKRTTQGRSMKVLLAPGESAVERSLDSISPRALALGGALLLLFWLAVALAG